MHSTSMFFYKALSKVGFLKKSYALKFLFVAFLGIHIPLIGIVLYVGFFAPLTIPPLDLFLLTLLFTLAATTITLFILNKLLQPVTLAKRTLLNYSQQKILPDLPVDFHDEVGILLQSIQQTIESLEAANKTKQEMIYTITHDLRSPLSQIVSLTDVLRKEREQPEKWLNLIQVAAQQELSFIDNYMSILETIDYRVEDQTTVTVELIVLVDHVMEMLKVPLANKEITVDVDVPQDAKVNTTKEFLFERVIRNLMSNAVKFSQRGGSISVSVRVIEGETILKVTDKGLGFEPEQAEKLFDKFTRLKRPGTNGEMANGIGLHLTREIVKKHGGVISAASDGPNKGATFTVRLKNI